MSAFIPLPIAVGTDPALTARTFTQNQTLFAALERLKTRGATSAANGVNTGAETPGGSDASDPCPIEPLAHSLTYAHLYQVHTATTGGIPAEIITVAADDITDAIQSAIAQLVEKHADGVRVTACREMKRRGAA